MASFFRWRIATKVIPLIARNKVEENLMKPSIISSLVKVNRTKGENSQLLLPLNALLKLASKADDLADPKELVRLLRNQGLPTKEGFTDITLCQYPFSIAFTLDKHVFSKIVLSEICANDEIIAKSSCLFLDVQPKNIVIQCRLPKIGELFKIPHLRSAIHANFIANINKAAGHKVIKVMHIADGGLESALLLTGFREFGISTELMKNPCQHLSAVSKAAKMQYTNDISFQQKVDLSLNKMEKGDEETLSDWKYLRNLCLEQYDSIFKKIGLTFDDSIFDSSYSSEIKDIRKDLLDKNLLVFQEDGTVKINLPDISDIKDHYQSEFADFAIFNLSSYVFSASHMKKKYNFDKLCYVAPTNEKIFYSVLFPLIKALGLEFSESLKHIMLKDISHFQRSGKNETAETVLNKGKIAILGTFREDLSIQIDEVQEQSAEALAHAAFCVHDMQHQRNVDYKFSWEEMLSFGKNSGLALQYCHAGLKGLQDDSEYKYQVEMDTSPLLDPVAQDLIQHLSRFDEIVYKSYLSLEPCILINYLFSLWYFTDRISSKLKLDDKVERFIVIKARLFLLSAALKILQRGLHLLGITPFETNYSPPDFIQK